MHTSQNHRPQVGQIIERTLLDQSTVPTGSAMPASMFSSVSCVPATWLPPSPVKQRASLALLSGVRRVVRRSLSHPSSTLSPSLTVLSSDRAPFCPSLALTSFETLLPFGKSPISPGSCSDWMASEASSAVDYDQHDESHSNLRRVGMHARFGLGERHLSSHTLRNAQLCQDGAFFFAQLDGC